MNALSLTLAPLVPLPLLVALAVIGLVLCLPALGLAGGKRARGGFLRLWVLMILLLALARPVITSEQREALPDVALIVRDATASMRLSGREERRDAIERQLTEKLSAFPDVEIRTTTVSGLERTDLHAGMREALRDVPPERIGAIFLLTDGQNHSAPAPHTAPAQASAAPTHLLLIGTPDEADRRIRILSAPAFARIGETVTLQAIVEDSGGSLAELGAPDIPVTLAPDSGAQSEIRARPGTPFDISWPINHAGTNAISLSVPARAGERSRINNRTAHAVQGVRDRLRVLLVSGEPYPGLRTWRNFLKADPAVDLVHFTILRPPDKQDATPISELSLIQFPTRELFVDRLENFDLIIFDRFRTSGVVPQEYLANIARFVERGGAFLDISGPAFAGPESLSFTPLGAILPLQPTGGITQARFRPARTETGKRHPVTATLAADQPWGHWLRALGGRPRSDAASAPQILLHGAGDTPLLALSHVGAGRAAQLLSDQVWLWARGYDGGGPHQELLRRIAHWLMQEPALEENALRMQVNEQNLEIVRQSLTDAPAPVTLTDPEGSVRTLALAPDPAAPGKASAQIALPLPGIWRAEMQSGTQTYRALAALGGLDAPEAGALTASAEPLRETIAPTGGGIAWLGERDLPALRRTQPHRPQAGSGALMQTSWLGVRAGGQSRVIGRESRPLLPAGLLLVLALIPLLLAWWRESR